MTQRRVVAVVLTFDRCERLPTVLDALAAQRLRPDHVLVVDNASTDDTHRVALDLAQRCGIGTTVLRLRRNGGSAEGYHVALDWCERSGFEWAWLVEDDLVPATDALQRLVERPEVDDPATVALACAVRDAAGAALLVPRGRLRRRFAGTPCVPVDEAEYARDRVRLDYFGFLGSLVRLDAVRRSGLPRREMLGWIDDVDFSSRLAATGDAWLVPGSVVVHDDGTTAAAFGAELRDRLRRLRDEPPVETMWRNAYGLRNLVCWGRASGFVRRRHAVAYALILSTRAALFAPDHRVLRVRIYLRMAIDGWRGRLRSAPPAQWPLIATWRGSVASFLDAHEMHHHGQAVDAVEQEQPAPA